MEYYKIICWSECPFCIKAKALLIEKGVPFEYCSVDHSNKLLEHYKKTYGHDTVPMVVKLKTWSKDDEFIGGYTELKKFFERS
jgi:glutaredoxin 3